jgi:hypothetical protein
MRASNLQKVFETDRLRLFWTLKLLSYDNRQKRFGFSLEGVVPPNNLDTWHGT